MKTKQDLVDDALALVVVHGPVYAMKWLASQFEDDSERLLFACADYDGFDGVEENKYDFAMQAAWKNGRDEPNHQDEVNGLRRLIDRVMSIREFN